MCVCVFVCVCVCLCVCVCVNVCNTRYHGSALFNKIPHIDMCTFEPSEVGTPPYTGKFTIVSLYRTAYCDPNGVHIIEVSMYRIAYCGPNGVLIRKVSLYRTPYCGPNDVLNIEVHCIQYSDSICIIYYVTDQLFGRRLMVVILVC